MKNNSDIKIIFIHGNGGATANDHWFPWLRTQLLKFGVKVIAKTFPDNQLARQKYWLPFIEELGVDKKTILIGHSSGGVAVMRFSQSHRILGSALISVNYEDLGDKSEKSSGYYDKPWLWEKIRKNQKWIIQFASKDDPYIPVSQARYIHHELKTEYYEFENRGHFGDPSHKTLEFKELLEVIKRRIT